MAKNASMSVSRVKSKMRENVFLCVDREQKERNSRLNISSLLSLFFLPILSLFFSFLSFLANLRPSPFSRGQFAK